MKNLDFNIVFKSAYKKIYDQAALWGIRPRQTLAHRILRELEEDLLSQAKEVE